MSELKQLIPEVMPFLRKDDEVIYDAGKGCYHVLAEAVVSSCRKGIVFIRIEKVLEQGSGDPVREDQIIPVVSTELFR